ncbi:hypothetical protein GCM10011320_46000 [Neoroseomonas lacus]|uniref:Integrase catalytic domain-containing protein n=1 Tax=Neoroseomonas lacus TaxID=287609 RepID=A0A917NVL6_9PROT|nr:hypothetical protein GCM10011320_46000 [Neoroseomonas lacus]
MQQKGDWLALAQEPTFNRRGSYAVAFRAADGREASGEVQRDGEVDGLKGADAGQVVPLIREAMERGEIFRTHAFELACTQNRIEHRLTKPYHPWTNGHVERMNRTLKEAIVQRYHHGSHDDLRSHLALFLDAYNYARLLKTLKGLTPYEFICRSWAAEPQRFTANPHHEMPGPDIWKHARSDRYSVQR